jgi:hypothetical protein
MHKDNAGEILVQALRLRASGHHETAEPLLDQFFACKENSRLAALAEAFPAFKITLQLLEVAERLSNIGAAADVLKTTVPSVALLSEFIKSQAGEFDAVVNASMDIAHEGARPLGILSFYDDWRESDETASDDTGERKGGFLRSV